MEKIKTIAENFVDDVISIVPLGAGHINDSFKMDTKEGLYVLQKINHNIFKDVDKLQDNILRVTKHVRGKLEDKNTTEINRKVLNFLPSKDGKYYYKDTDGNYWRVMDFILDSKSYDSITPELSEKAGEAFGDFQNMLADLPGGPLFETIPNFHNMETRLNDFRESVKNNASGRANKAEVKAIIDEIEKRSEDMCRPEKLHREGKLPKRTNHCDTKVNNILFDNEGNVLCVVDLDTVMPGFVLSDFGDFMRTGANNGEEDDTNLDKVTINLDIFEAYTKGYLRTASKFLTDVELDNLAFGAKLLTYMQTVRFFTDYIDGDKYYKTKGPNHNWERTLAQFKLLTSMEENFDKMQAIVKKYK